MIRERLIALRERRAHLVALAETQRADTLVMVRRAELATAWFDRAAFYARWLRGQPVLVAVAVALLVALRPAKALKWFGTGISLWRSWKSLSAVIDRLAPDRVPARGAYRA